MEIDNVINREQKIVFIERSHNPLDNRLKSSLRRINQLTDADLDEVYKLYLDKSIRCRETLIYLYAEKPHLAIIVAHLSDERVNRLFSSMKVIKYTERAEIITVVFAIVACLTLIFGAYIHYLTIVFFALALFLVDVLLILRVRTKIQLLLQDPDLMKIFTD